MNRWFKRILVALAALVVLPLIALYCASLRPGAGSMRHSVDIAGTPEQIWPWIDDGSRLKQWVSWMVEVREPQPPHHQAGSPIAWVMRDENNGGMMMTLEGRISEYQPPARIAIVISAPQYHFAGEESYRLTDLGNGRTRLTCDSTYRYQQWYVRLMEPLITMEAGKKMDRDLARLKSLAEAQAER